MPVEQATEIIKMVTRGSSVLRMAKVEEMKHEKKSLTYLQTVRVLTGSVRVRELKQAVLLGFTPEIEAKKLAVIIPVTKEAGRYDYQRI